MLSERQAAQVLGISAWSLRQLRLRGEIEYIRLTPKRVGYTPEILDRFVERRTVRAKVLPLRGAS